MTSTAETPPSRAELKQASGAWESLMRTYVELGRQFATDPEWRELSMREYDVLYSLAKAGRPMKQSELLDAVLLSQPAVSRMLGRMEKKGWLSRCEDPSDGRQAQISLSEEGRMLQRRVGKQHGAHVEERLRRGLTVEQMSNLQELCDSLTSAVSKQRN